MKAYALEAVGKLNYIDVQDPQCPQGWALIEVKAAGICSSDIPRIFHKGTYNFPTIPGHEFSGIVRYVGSESDQYWLNKNVGVFPLIPCKECLQCKSGNYEMCENYDYVGSRRDGGFAEIVAVPVWNLIELGDNVSFEVAAMLEPISVALHAIKQGNVKKGDSVAIIGTGMIGFAAAQWAKSAGATSVTIMGRNEEKKEIALQLGLNYEILYNTIHQFDMVLEAVGSNQAINQAIEIVKPGGRLVLMGNPEDNIQIPQNTYWRILRKQLHLIGTWNSKYESGNKCDWSEAIQAINEGKVKVESLISHRYGQEDLECGLMLMKKHTESYCKVMSIWNKKDEK